MSTYNVYMHTQSGDIATKEAWRDDFERMDIESWFGLPADQCDPENWISGGALAEITLESDDSLNDRTSRLFPGCFNDKCTDGSWIDEWCMPATDNEGNEYAIVYHFLVGGPCGLDEETQDDDLPWEDESNIYAIKAI